MVFPDVVQQRSIKLFVRMDDGEKPRKLGNLIHDGVGEVKMMKLSSGRQKHFDRVFIPAVNQQQQLPLISCSCARPNMCSTWVRFDLCVVLRPLSLINLVCSCSEEKLNRAEG